MTFIAVRTSTAQHSTAQHFSLDIRPPLIVAGQQGSRVALSSSSLALEEPVDLAGDRIDLNVIKSRACRQARHR